MNRILPIRTLIIAFLCYAVPGVCSADQSIIDQLTAQIETCTSDEEKGKLFMYRARNHANLKEYPKALSDYDNALATTHKGWIHLERSRFFIARKEYALAVREARAAEAETPTLSYQANQIAAVATRHLEAIYLRENPPEIILSQQVDPNRKSRFDIARERAGSIRTAGNDFVAWRKKREAAKMKAAPGKASSPPRRVARS